MAIPAPLKPNTMTYVGSAIFQPPPSVVQPATAAHATRQNVPFLLFRLARWSRVAERSLAEQAAHVFIFIDGDVQVSRRDADVGMTCCIPDLGETSAAM